MARAYTLSLLSVVDSLMDSGIYSGPVPAGYRWVVRNVNALSPVGVYTAATYGYVLNRLSDSQVISSVRSPFAQNSRQYAWEGRVVLEAGDQLALFTYDAGWFIEVTGYQLSLT